MFGRSVLQYSSLFSKSKSIIYEAKTKIMGKTGGREGKIRYQHLKKRERERVITNEDPCVEQFPVCHAI